MRYLHILVVLFISSFLPFTSFSQEVPNTVKAKLVSDIVSVKPGGKFNLGVLFEIDPGWHIYWKYPGETGLPTKISFLAPKEFEISELQWPVPKTIEKPDGGYDYGYKNSVLLWSTIEVPENITHGSEFEIQAEVSWISCKEICIPGKANLTFMAKVAQETKLVNKSLFSKWQKRLPRNINNVED